MNDPPVTIDIIKQVKPGCESDFEVVLADLIAAAEGFDGHLGRECISLWLRIPHRLQIQPFDRSASLGSITTASQIVRTSQTVNCR